MNAVLLDTSCIVALLDQSDHDHARSAEALAEIADPLITCEAVLAESCYLLRGISGASAALLENVERGVILVPYRVSENARRLAKLLKAYANIPMDFADACLVDMATAFATGRILTLDRDFLIYRWARNRPFQNLLEF